MVRNVNLVLLMGTCFSSELDDDLSFYSETDEIQPSSIEDASKIPSGQSSYDSSDHRQNLGYRKLDSFTYDEMRMATQLFRGSQVLGEGGFGVVYKGIIDESVRSGYTRTEVAIKKLDPQGMQGEKEWLTELNYLARLRHPNLVKLIGYCSEKNYRLLVYEYMEAGSLDVNLFINLEKGAKHPLSWDRRMKIALDAAKGLSYLHNCKRPVIYRDFKSSNILLDMDFNAKLSDFGIAKDAPRGKYTHITTRIMGTLGYTAPDYIRTGHLRASTDVYAFGVVLLELMMGLPAIDRNRPSSQHYLVEWARPYLTNKKALLEIMDPRIDGQYPSKHAIRLGKIAHRCLHQSYVMRPSMTQILRMLESVQTAKASLQSESGSVTASDHKRNGKSSKR